MYLRLFLIYSKGGPILHAFITPFTCFAATIAYAFKPKVIIVNCGHFGFGGFLSNMANITNEILVGVIDDTWWDVTIPLPEKDEDIGKEQYHNKFGCHTFVYQLVDEAVVLRKNDLDNWEDINGIIFGKLTNEQIVEVQDYTEDL
ncbi:hypothetical protein ACJX0J_020610, partial [Zea mays]